jgi:hypothetical protein
VCPKYSHMFLSSKRTKYNERRMAIHFRGGCLLSSQQHTLGHRCPLCSSNSDSGSHVLLQCPFPPLDRLRTERHNHAARLLFSAIQSGTCGSSLIMVDIGCPTKRSATSMSLASLPSTIPTSVLDLPSTQRRSFKPDGLMIIKRNPLTTHYNRTLDTVHIIEFKYCHDAFYSTSLSQHANQHTALRSQLRSQGWHNVFIHHLRMGVGGSVFKPTLLTLTSTLGVTSDSANALAKALHFYSVSHLSTMITTRFFYCGPHCGPGLRPDPP